MISPQELQPKTSASQKKAKPVYSRARTAFLSLTPGDSKCALYCKGATCKYCIPQKQLISINQAIPGLYSTWITEDFLAMSRPQKEHFEKYNLVENFKSNGIASVINLQESGEHGFCGSGVGPSGFSYDPEELMKHSIYYYNFPMPDFESCSPNRLLDIVKVVQFSLTQGKVAVHCHAGHGRTGMVLAAAMIYCQGMTPKDAVKCVRSARPNSVQSAQQVEALHNFMLLVENEGGLIIPPKKFLNINQYLSYNMKFLPKSEARLYGNIPKIAYVGMTMLLEMFYDSVTIHLVILEDNRFGQFVCQCYGYRMADDEYEESEVKEKLSSDHFRYSLALYLRLTSRGMSISTMKKFFRSLDFYQIAHLIDLFFTSSFHQLTYRDEILSLMNVRQEGGFLLPQTDGSRDWMFTYFFCIECLAVMPEQFHLPMAQIISRWFLRKDDKLPEEIVNWIYS